MLAVPTAFAKSADHTQHMCRRAIGERLANALVETLQAVEFVDVQGRVVREIGLGQDVEKAVAAELAERELERFGMIGMITFKISFYLAT